MSALAEPTVAAVVYEGVEVAAGPVVEHPDDYVVMAVAVEISDTSRPCAVGRQLDTGSLPKGVAVQEGRRLLTVGLAVADDEVQVAVAVEVELVDALKYASTGDVDVLPAVAEYAPAKGVEPLGDHNAAARHRSLHPRPKLRALYLGSVPASNREGR